METTNSVLIEIGFFEYNCNDIHQNHDLNKYRKLALDSMYAKRKLLKKIYINEFKK